MNKRRFFSDSSMIIFVLGVVSLAVLLAALILGRWFTMTNNVKPQLTDTFQVFVGLLEVLFAVIAVGIAAFGYGAYRILSNAIQKDIMNAIELERTKEGLIHAKLSLHLANYLSYNQWFEWDISGRSNRKIETLKTIIDMSKLVRDYVNYIDKQASGVIANKKNEKECLEIFEELKYLRKQILSLESNLAYYIADYKDFASLDDQDLARELAQKVYDSLEIKDPSKIREYWRLETYCWVLKQLRRTDQDTSESKRLMSEILKRKDIPKDELTWYKEKHQLSDDL